MISYIAHCRSDYYLYDRRVFIDKRLPGMEYAQAGILYEPWGEMLVSYETIVAELTSDGWIKVYAMPSRTTGKHLAKWGRMHGVDYYTLKNCFDSGLDFNIYDKKTRKTDNATIRTIGVAV